MTSAFHSTVRTVLAVATALTVLAVLYVGQLKAQRYGNSAVSSQVLVAPLQVTSDVDSDLGRKVAEEVYDRVQNFAVLSPVDEDDVNDAINRFDLDGDEMAPIQWRQLANQIGAGLVLSGQLSRGTNQREYRLEVAWVDVSSGDELRVGPFRARGGKDEAVRAATDTAIAALQRQVRFLRRTAFCSDYYQSEQYEDALSNCNTALEANENGSRAHRILAQIHEQRENWKEAGQHYKAVLDAHSKDVEALSGLAHALARQGQYDQSLELYRKYVNFNPGDVDMRLEVASELRNTGGLTQAMELIEQGIQRDSTSALLWEYLGLLASLKATQPPQSTSDTTTWKKAVNAYRKVREITGGLSAEQQQSLSTATHKLSSARGTEVPTERRRLQWSGTGDRTTQSFTASEPGWRIEWTLRGDNMSTINITVKNASTGETVTTASSNAPGSQRSFVHQAGRFYLEIISANARWTVNAFPDQSE